MADVRIELNRGAVRQLLRSPEVLADLTDRAQRVAAAAGGGEDFEVDAGLGPNRARASVRTATSKGRHLEATDRALTRAIDAAR